MFPYVKSYWYAKKNDKGMKGASIKECLFALYLEDIFKHDDAIIRGQYFYPAMAHAMVVK